MLGTRFLGLRCSPAASSTATPYGGVRSMAGESERERERKGKGERCVQYVSTRGKGMLGGLQREAGGGATHAHADALGGVLLARGGRRPPCPLWAGLVLASWARGRWGGLGFLFLFFLLFLLSVFFFCNLFCLGLNS